MTTRRKRGISIPESRMEEYEDLLCLLKDNLSVPADEGEAVAEWVAASCLGEDHLWQDMRLPNRASLSALIDHNFRPLFEANVTDMKWKKFFYRKICEREGFHMCKSPSCGECVDFVKCFGPEDAGTGERTVSREGQR